MRLTQLEIKGFKSFPDKTIIHFNPGITGIIGPNGCGKSNIIDSIRWVIGEQKISALRSENLESLVFNGSKTRSPSGLAEVSLTFENTKNLLPTEFNTVTITRRFFKNGESEYRLNDVSCRLKDIHNLFIDTGVSTDSYAIIELGMVDDIIKDKDNSRRRMIEQAAGITIYKTRKKEAKAKLEATAQDLNRIEDLLFEISNQLKTLESQANKASRYFTIKEEYKKLSIELAKTALEDFNHSYKTLTAQYEAENDKKIQLDASVATLEAETEKQNFIFLEKEKLLQERQQAFNRLIEQLRHKENEKELITQKLHYLKEKHTSLQTSIQQASLQLNTIESSLQFTHQQIQEETEQLNICLQNTQQAETELANSRAFFDEQRKRIDAARSRHQTLQREQFEAEKKVAVSDSSIQNLQRSITQHSEEQKLRAQQIQTLTEELQHKEAALQNKQELLETLQQQHNTTKEQILTTQQELENLRHKLSEENRKADARKNEYDLLKSLIDSMEGYPESIRFLHNNKEWNAQAPILSDIIYVQEAYRTAIENLLEPFLNYYVVATWQEAFHAIELLQAHKKGKANFFILEEIHKTFQPIPLVALPNETTWALDVIEVDEPYKDLAAYLLQKVIISEGETLPETNAFIVLQKNSSFVKGQYTLTGGSIGLFEGKRIGRAKNLEKLQDELIIQQAIVQALKTEVKQKQEEVFNHQEQLKEKAIQQTQNEIHQLHNQLAVIKNKIDTLQSTHQQTENRIQELQIRNQQEQQQIVTIQEQLKNLNATLQQITEELKAGEEEYKKAEQNYNAAAAQYNELNLKLTKQQSKLNAVQQEYSFKKNQLNELHTQIDNNQLLSKETENNILQNEQELISITEVYTNMLRHKSAEEKLLNEADAEYYKLRQQLQEAESQLKQNHKLRENTDVLLHEIKDSINELKLQVTSVKERLHVEFNISLDEILDEPRTTSYTLDELQTETDKLKKRLENMGEINPTAVEAFTEMKKRYEFILEQKNDLTTAKEDLLKTIEEVETTANQQFLATFEQVRENFKQVFKALFTEEDTADLILEQPDNIAETAIDIVAKPKGKKPSSITQLSGGEKTLTATALLFAIYLIKPAPFCILDEVDAPLDDANVGKFTQMIQKFSANSQFIIVTHNKMTMSSVDAIYGVTMQEAGVSKLVPVDFRNLN
jgi:chromosome segregation protein